MGKFELVIFDLDGTLVDSDKTVIRILNTIRKDLTLPALKLKDISFDDFSNITTKNFFNLFGKIG